MTQLERMARAMCALSVELDMEDGQSWLKLARYGLEAIREPSEGMWDAAWRLDKIGPDAIGVPYQGIPEDMWPAMIDAALEEG